MKTKLLLVPLFLITGMVWGQEIRSDKMYLLESPSYKDVNVDPSNILRIESELYASWSGVNSCDKRERLISNTDEAALKWVKNQLFENRNSQWIRYGWYYETPKVTNRRNPWPDSSRSCTGSVKFKAYIEFKK